MFLLILSFSIALMWPLKTGIFDRALLAGLCFPLLFIGLNIMGLPVHSDLLLDCIAALLLVVALRHYWRNRSGQSGRTTVSSWQRGDGLATLALMLLFVLAMELQYAGNGVLPVHDPIAVPSIARRIFLTGDALLDHFAPGAYHGAYPPGYPVLTSLFYSRLGNAAVLLAFKHINILIIACIPVGRLTVPLKKIRQRLLTFYRL